jgi:hypothetical protein
MKKALLVVAVASVVVVITYKFLNKGEQVDAPKTDPIEVAISGEVTTNISSVLEAYFDVRDAFVASDTITVVSASKKLDDKLAGLKLEEVSSDAAVLETAKQYQQTVQAENSNIQSLTGLEAKRKSFQAASDALFDLLRVVRYNGATIYQLRCPMAFQNTGANWLSKTEDIKNPYFGSAMLECGFVRDSVSVQQ